MEIVRPNVNAVEPEVGPMDIPAGWLEIADAADEYWYLHGSDNVHDETFKARFGVSMFEHAALSRQTGRWK